jgi:branched-chain amino acid transport system ATP-binding protein
MILELNNINTFYGSSHILFNLSLAVEEGETVCLLGRNGAGKTTTLRSIMGLTSPRSGSIRFRGQEIAKKNPTAISRLGVGFVPEDRRIFPSLTVREQLEVAQKKGKGDWNLEKIFVMFPQLERLQKRLGNQLSGGEQQMLTIGRTLMGNPELLLLDEPSEGLAPLVVEALAEQIKRLSEQKITLLLSEMGLGLAVNISHRAYVIDKGQIQWSGTCEELKGNEELKIKYLAL